MKYFLLVAGDQYYPYAGDGDWVGCFETEEEAEKEYQKLIIEGAKFDWFRIINLEPWIKKGDPLNLQ